MPSKSLKDYTNQLTTASNSSHSQNVKTELSNPQPQVQPSNLFHFKTTTKTWTVFAEFKTNKCFMVAWQQDFLSYFAVSYIFLFVCGWSPSNEHSGVKSFDWSAQQHSLLFYSELEIVYFEFAGLKLCSFIEKFISIPSVVR